jgi:hypothetical protein
MERWNNVSHQKSGLASKYGSMGGFLSTRKLYRLIPVVLGSGEIKRCHDGLLGGLRHWRVRVRGFIGVRSKGLYKIFVCLRLLA